MIELEKINNLMYKIKFAQNGKILGYAHFEQSEFYISLMQKENWSVGALTEIAKEVKKLNDDVYNDLDDLDEEFKNILDE
jgi:hypothetical protein